MARRYVGNDNETGPRIVPTSTTTGPDARREFVQQQLIQHETARSKEVDDFREDYPGVTLVVRFRGGVCLLRRIGIPTRCTWVGLSSFGAVCSTPADRFTCVVSGLMAHANEKIEEEATKGS